MLPIRILWSNLQENELSLLSTIISFLLFITLLPGWAKARWKEENYFATMGLLSYSKINFIRYLLRGLLCSSGLIFIVLFSVLLTPWGNWLGAFNFGIALNAILLAFLVGFAEEVIFRGWLLTEMKYMFGKRLGLFVQAAIFSFIHLRFDYDFWSSLGLLTGLFLLGILLGLIINNECGSIWGCVGLHGGLVGGWFFVSNGIVEFSSKTPGWLFGPGGSTLNPIGGLLSILTLLFIIYSQRTAFAIAGRPFKGACKASSKGDLP